MLKFLKAYICKLLPALISSEEYLEGLWKSSIELTQEKNNFSILPSNKLEFINQTFGDLVVEYRNELFYEESPNKTITVNGKSFDWHGAKKETSVPYKVIRKNNTGIYVVSKNPYGKGWLINQLDFISDSIYKVKGSDIDEYFVRQ